MSKKQHTSALKKFSKIVFGETRAHDDQYTTKEKQEKEYKIPFNI